MPCCCSEAAIANHCEFVACDNVEGADCGMSSEVPREILAKTFCVVVCLAAASRVGEVFLQPLLLHMLI